MTSDFRYCGVDVIMEVSTFSRPPSWTLHVARPNPDFEIPLLCNHKIWLDFAPRNALENTNSVIRS